MGETAKYFVPDDEARFIGKEREVAEAFWQRGVFIVTSDRFIYDRIKQWNAEGRPLPEWKHDFTFVEMGVGESKLMDPVPNSIYDLVCPACGTALSDAAYGVWNDEESPLPLPDRVVVCGGCGARHRSGQLQSKETPFTFARFYLWVADIEEADWDSTFKQTVEAVLGPCREFTAWET
jgi:hypothetical protein